jgi:hypothetical protein
LEDQFNEDKAVLWFSPFPPPVTLFPGDWHEYSVARMGFMTNADEENQYLLIYHLHGGLRTGVMGKVSFFINSNYVGAEYVDGEEFIALLLDCPPSQEWYYLYMFLTTGDIEVKGIECYIL